MRRRLRRFTAVVSSPLRVLPDVVVIGAMRCGTTELNRILKHHPQLRGAARKEVHYFDWHYRFGEGWYRSFFPTRASMKAAERSSGAPVHAFEASPYYLFHPHAAERLRLLLPDAKLIALLRDPVARAHSHYIHNTVDRSGREPLSFEAAIDQEPARIEAEAARLDRDPDYNSTPHRWYSYLARGIYVDQLQRWHAVFPKEQLLILKAEDFYRKQPETLHRVCEYVGVRDFTPEEIPGREPSRRYPPMAEATRLRLQDYFRPHNERLSSYLGQDFRWGA